MADASNNSVCRKDIPYPSVSPESVASAMNNLTSALYGSFTKTVQAGRVIWNIPCDPVDAPATVFDLPRNAGEGLLCYFIRAFNEANNGDATFYGTFEGDLIGYADYAVNIDGGSANTLVYQTAEGETAFLPPGLQDQVLITSSTGAPAWSTPFSSIAAALIFG